MCKYVCRVFLIRFFLWRGQGEENKRETETKRDRRKGRKERRKEESSPFLIPDPGCYLVRMRCLELLNPLIWSSDGRAIKRKEPGSLMT